MSDKIRCPICGMPTIEDRSDLEDIDMVCNACGDALEEDANREMGLPDGFDWGCK